MTSSLGDTYRSQSNTARIGGSRIGTCRWVTESYLNCLTESLVNGHVYNSC